MLIQIINIAQLVKLINNSNPNRFQKLKLSRHMLSVGTHKEWMLANPTLNGLRTRARNLDLQQST